MPNQPFGTEYEKEWHQIRELQQAVLQRLMEVGPQQWDALYDHFNHAPSGEVAQTLRYLARGMLITVEPGGTVTITASGVNQLQRCEKLPQ
jgi:hypothetical protein